MVNQPSSTPPPSQGPKPDKTVGEVGGPQETHETTKYSGEVHFKNPGEFLGMHFTQKDWDKLMNIFLRNLGDFINKTYQKAIKKMKENWRREKGKS